MDTVEEPEFATRLRMVPVVGLGMVRSVGDDRICIRRQVSRGGVCQASRSLGEPLRMKLSREDEPEEEIAALDVFQILSEPQIPTGSEEIRTDGHCAQSAPEKGRGIEGIGSTRKRHEQFRLDRGAQATVSESRPSARGADDPRGTWSFRRREDTARWFRTSSVFVSLTPNWRPTPALQFPQVFDQRHSVVEFEVVFEGLVGDLDVS